MCLWWHARRAATAVGNKVPTMRESAHVAYTNLMRLFCDFRAFITKPLLVQSVQRATGVLLTPAANSRCRSRRCPRTKPKR